MPPLQNALKITVGPTSVIIGTKEFVGKNYKLFKDVFQLKHEKKPKPIKGLDGVYSLKRLAETIA